jgi:hypothetical protein
VKHAELELGTVVGAQPLGGGGRGERTGHELPWDAVALNGDHRAQVAHGEHQQGGVAGLLGGGHGRPVVALADPEDRGRSWGA